MVPFDSRIRVWERVGAESGVVERLDIISSPVLAQGSVNFCKVTALTGVHGVGKSYLLYALAAGLPGWQTRDNLPIDLDDSETAFRGDYVLTLRSGSPTDLAAFTRPVSYKDRAAQDASLEPLVATWLTPHKALDELAYFSQDWMFPHPIEPVEVADLTRADLDAIRMITGHTCETVTYGRYDTRDGYFPYVRIVRDSREVEPRTMSASEFWVHFVLWHLHSADENETVLIDEPETFLAQPGHRAFIDEIARLALKSGCQVVLATHSETMIRRIPAKLVRQVSNTASGALVSAVTNTATLLRILGRSRAQLSLLVFVEDDLARRIVYYLLGCFAPDRVEQVDVIDSGGKDQALRGAKISGRSERLRTVCVLDGDQRDAYTGDQLLFLPGLLAPEMSLLEILRRHDYEAANALGVKAPDLNISIDATKFVDHQHVFNVMSESLVSATADDLVRVAISLWVQDADTATVARQLVEQILALVEN